MKSTLALLLLATVSAGPLFAVDPPKPADPFEEGMRQAFTAYKKGDDEAVASKLRELLKIMDEKGAAKLGGLLPDTVGAWKGETLQRDDLAAGGGGVSMSRVYASGEHKITTKVVKDSPIVDQLLPLFVNEDLLRTSGRKMHRISGEIGVMEGENKLQVIVAQKIYLELEGDAGTGETDLVAFAEKLDLKAMAKLK